MLVAWRTPRPLAWLDDLDLLRPDHGVLGDFDEVPFPKLVEAVEEARIHPVVLISRDPLKGQWPTSGDARDHLQRQFRLGLKLQTNGDATTLALLSGLIAQPNFRQIEPTIYEGGSAAAGVGQENSVLTVVYFAQRRRSIAARPRPSIRLWKAAAIANQPAVRLADVLCDQLPASLEQRRILPSAFANCCTARTASAAGPFKASTIGSTVLRSRSESCPFK